MSYMRDICLMCVLYYLFTYFAGIAPCMGLRVSFVLFHLSKYYIDYVYVYVYTFDYLCNVLNKIVIITVISFSMITSRVITGAIRPVIDVEFFMHRMTFKLRRQSRKNILLKLLLFSCSLCS